MKCYILFLTFNRYGIKNHHKCMQWNFSASLKWYDIIYICILFVLVIIWTRVQLLFNSRVVSKKLQNFTESGLNYMEFQWWGHCIDVNFAFENTSEDHAVQSLFLNSSAECNYRLVALSSTNQNRVIMHSIWLEK